MTNEEVAALFEPGRIDGKVWSGGPLLPERDERPLFPQKRTRDRTGRPALHKDYPAHTKTVRCVICGKQTKRPANTVKYRKAHGLAQVCSSRCAWEWRARGGRAA